MTRPDPILTIVVPSYNVEAYLAKGLASYADERLIDVLEVIVVDDGSTDGTRAIAEEFAVRFPRIFHVVSKCNGGHGSAVNAGLVAARGRYFRIIDGDDWVDTNALVSFVGELATYEADLVIDVKREVRMGNGEERLFPLPADVPRGADVSFEGVCTRPEFADLIMIHTLTVRVDHLRSCGVQLLEHAFYVDYEYVVKAALNARTVRFVDLNVYQYLVGNAAQSVADASYVRRWDDHERVTREILRLHGEQASGLSVPRAAFLTRKATLVVNTHYNIALIFDADRHRGLARARSFRAFLRAEHPDIAAATERRYRRAWLLHYLGVDSQERLDGITGR